MNSAQRFKHCLIAAVLTSVTSFANAQVQVITQPSTGTHDGWFYAFWQDTGAASLTLLENGHYSAQWGTDTNNWFGGFGWEKGGYRIVNYTGNYSPASDANAFLSVYGWMKNPLLEYYIIENWGTWNPSEAPNTDYFGSYESDGATYDLYRTRRVSGLDINAQDRIFYYSIRQNKKPIGAIRGTINTGNHFNAWAKLGLPIGAMQYMILATESYQGNGTSDITVSTSPADCGTIDGNPICCTIEADPDYDEYGEQFDGQLCVVAEQTIGWHPANPDDVIAAINVGGFWESYENNAIWYEPNRYLSGASYTANKTLTSGSDSAIYQSAGVGAITIAIPVEGQQTVSVELGFVESRYSSANRRVFDITIEGQKAYRDLDIYAQVGANSLWAPTPFTVQVSDGELNIQLDSTIATLSSVLVRKIEATASSSSASATPIPLGGSIAAWLLWALWALGGIWRFNREQKLTQSQIRPAKITKF